MHQFRVGETVTVTVVIEETFSSSITTTIRAIIDDRIYLDVDGIDLFTETGYITCTRTVCYNTKIKKLCGEFLDTSEDGFTDEHPATITYKSPREDW